MVEGEANDESGTTATPSSETVDVVADPREAVLGAEGLSRTFGEFVAVDQVDLAIPEGEFRAIIGPNGAGKTTLFNVLTNAIPPSAGAVYFQGRDITDVPQYERPHMGLVRSFQSNQMFSEQTVLENVRIVAQTIEQGPFAFDLLGRGRDIARDRAYEVLDMLNLDSLADELARNLSHGDQRRLGIAMALATDPTVLLLDEPTSGMGPAETEETAALIGSIQNELGFTLLLIEHDMNVVLARSDRITVLHQGQVIVTGSPEEIRENEQVQEAYLGGLEEEL